MTHHLTLDGAAIHGISDFYREINRLFMAAESWSLGESLDALDDMLHGGYGLLADGISVMLTWTAADHSRKALGRDATHAWLHDKLNRPGYDNARIQRQLDALMSGTGPTYFDTVLEIFADHPQVQLTLLTTPERNNAQKGTEEVN